MIFCDHCSTSDRITACKNAILTFGSFLGYENHFDSLNVIMHIFYSEAEKKYPFIAYLMRICI
ncbi:MAG: hypothetical protein BWK80_49540 [Desulfobacteraceae bacterium IS3]|nr:MAG: hypothetical protein BWK80_49540 [Desulfobacteraceae bacterium IS3]